MACVVDNKQCAIGTRNFRFLYLFLNIYVAAKLIFFYLNFRLYAVKVLLDVTVNIVDT